MSYEYQLIPDEKSDNHLTTAGNLSKCFHRVYCWLDERRIRRTQRLVLHLFFATSLELTQRGTSYLSLQEILQSSSRIAW